MRNRAMFPMIAAFVVSRASLVRSLRTRASGPAMRTTESPEVLDVGVVELELDPLDLGIAKAGAGDQGVDPVRITHRGPFR